MAIAKYRKAEYPGEWFLTDFTMEQVEGRLANLESENARLREALLECVRISSLAIRMGLQQVSPPEGEFSGPPWLPSVP